MLLFVAVALAQEPPTQQQAKPDKPCTERIETSLEQSQQKVDELIALLNAQAEQKAEPAATPAKPDTATETGEPKSGGGGDPATAPAPTL